jgi:quercetin dioxygenase-like cupin family protein
MKVTDLLADLEYHDADAYAQPLYVSAEGRVLRFMLKPGQGIRQHNAPSSPFYAVMLKGRGVFTDAAGAEEQVGPGSLLLFEPGENHAIQALDEDLVFVGFLHGTPGNPGDRVGGEMSRQES